MNREDLVWVVIRVVGLFLLLRFVLMIPDILHAATLAFVFSGSEVIDPNADAWLKTAYSNAGQTVVAMLLHLGLGLYLLRGGKWVFGLVRFPEK